MKILETGRNCWRISPADQVAFLVDGEAFFCAFRKAARQARHSIVMLGWDFDSRFELVRDSDDDGLPTALREFLNRLARERPSLRVHVLNWDFAWLMAPDREWISRAKMDWTTHEHVHYRFDAAHPAGASHHQKVVVIDDALAFVGGLDFTRGRWDSIQHAPDDPRRRDHAGEPMQPYHDVQLMLSGPAARDLGDLARARWKAACGEGLEAPPAVDGAPWPDGFKAELSQVHAGISRTFGAHDGKPAVREVEKLLLDAIAAARHWIYIENQYFTAPVICDAIAERLAEEDGPEVVLVLPYRTVGWLSQNTMDVLRERRIRQLQEADRHERLRVCYADRPDLGDECINLHSKVLVVDDDLACVGSANLNNRSMGLDSECNVTIESRGHDEHRAGIARLRNRLLAEHLDCAHEEVAAQLDREGSLIRTVSKLRSAGRTLSELPLSVSKERDAMVPGTELADPEEAIDVKYFADRSIRERDRKPVWRGIAGLASVIALALILAAAWRWTPLNEWIDVPAALDRMAALKGHWLAPLAVVVIYVVAGLLMVPVTLLIVATGLAFGGVFGFSYALLGSVLSALAAYAIGHHVGRNAVERLSSQWVARANRFVGRQGLLAMITLRIIPVAPFTVVNIVAGASRIGIRDFTLGTLIGMIPGTFALVVLSAQIVAAIRSPDAVQIALLLGLAALILAASWGVRRWISRRSSA